MPIDFSCSQCGKEYRNVRDDYAGKRLKCKCGAVNRAPDLPASEIDSPLDPLGFPSTDTRDLLAPVQVPKTNNESAVEAQSHESKSSSSHGRNGPKKGNHWGKPQVNVTSQVDDEEDENLTESKDKEREREIAQRKDGPLLTRIVCGISAVSSLIIAVGCGLGVIGLFNLKSTPQNQHLSTIGLTLSIVTCLLTCIAAIVFFKFSVEAIRESFHYSRAVRISPVATAKAGASAVIFAVVTLGCSFAGFVSAVGHTVLMPRENSSLISAIAINLSVTAIFVGIAALVIYVARFRHGPFKLSILLEESEDVD